MASIRIVEYEPGHQPYFEAFNKAWIEKHFWLEDLDRYVLENPEQAIIRPGGAILMALYEGEPAGTVALKKVDGGTYEFSKMAVKEVYHRKGIAEALSYAAFEKAISLGGKKVILFSHTHLAPAILLYNKLGFKEVPMEGGLYKRANIKMEIDLPTFIVK